MLAHAARGFNARYTVEGIASLRGIDNVFFDTSAICEAAAMEAMLREFGPTLLGFDEITIGWRRPCRRS